MNLLFVIILLAFSIIPAFGESHPEFSGLDNPLNYTLHVDDHSFSIPFQVDGEVLAMAVDPELTSFLIGLENTKDSIMIIDLKHEIISAQNNEFAILVNGVEVDYTLVSDSDSSTLSFFVPEFTEEVEIIGTHVIPEFPLGFIVVFVALLGVVTFVSRSKISFFRL